jgi:hypothetical protein
VTNFEIGLNYFTEMGLVLGEIGEFSELPKKKATCVASARSEESRSEEAMRIRKEWSLLSFREII